jgi:uncharacterized protein YndB with AHSA1/START domain
VHDDAIEPDLEIVRAMDASPHQIWSAWIDPAAIVAAGG